VRALVFLAAGMLAVAFVAGASAHAEPARIKPGDGAVLNVAPLQVEMEMSQEMARQAGANDIEVLDASGRKVTAVSAVIDNANRKKLTVPLPSDLKPGKYTVNWKTLSADDGDNANGSFSFTFDPAATPSAGKEVVREDVLGGAAATSPTGAAVNVDTGASDTSPSWVFVAAVGVAMFVLGGGGTFLLVQKKP
jgi:hypothetical protein